METEFYLELYAAAFAGDMLSGIDFLSQLRATIHLNNPRFNLGEEDIPLRYGNFPGGVGWQGFMYITGQ